MYGESFRLQTIGKSSRPARWPASVSFEAQVAQRSLSIDTRDRLRLERLARYVSRPAVSTERLSELPDGRLLYPLKRKWRNGTTKAIAGGPIRGSWWGHAKGRTIFRAAQAVCECPDVLVCKLIDDKSHASAVLAGSPAGFPAWLESRCPRAGITPLSDTIGQSHPLEIPIVPLAIHAFCSSSSGGEKASHVHPFL